jgi:hypothetical protein
MTTSREVQSLMGPRPPFAARMGGLEANLPGGGVPTLTPDLSYLEMHPEACHELLERVVNSRELKRALRLRELLLFVGKRALEDLPRVLREQEIGAAVFGRPEDYDTTLDNIVRVNFSELRKRLAHFFQDEGAPEPVLIEIPRGGYLPVFLPRPVEPATKPAEAVPMAEASEAVMEPALAKPADVPAEASAIAIPEHEPASRQVRFSVPVVVAVAVLLLIASCASVWLAWQNHRMALQAEPWKADPAIASLWSEFFGSGQDVDIVTADSSFALAEDLVGREISLEDYLDYKYRSVADQPDLTPATRTALLLVLDRNNGSIGDFRAAERFRDLDARSSAVKLESARSYTTESIKSNNVILIGGRQSNPWVDLYKDRMNFFMECEPGRNRSYVINRNPAPGEQKLYEPSDRSHGYSVVAFVPNLAEHRYAMIVSGTDSQATRAAGEWVTSSEGLAEIRRKLPTGKFPYFEVVLASSRLVGTTLHSEVVAYRVHER